MRVLREFRHISDYVYTVAFSPDGRFVLSSATDRTRLWDTKTGKEIRSFKGSTGAVFSKDGKSIVTIDGGPFLRLYEVETDKEICSFEPHNNIGYCVAFSPDGRFILSGGGLLKDNKLVPGGFLFLWDTQTRKVIRRFDGYRGPVTSVIFTPDGKCAIASGDGTLRLWEIETGKELRCSGTSHESYEGSPRSRLSFSPDGKHFLAGLTLYNLDTWKEVREYKRSSRGRSSDPGTNSVAFSPDGKRFVSGDYDGLIRLWDVESGKEICHVFGLKTEGKILSVAFSPDGRSVLASGDSWIGFESLRRGLPGSDPYVRLWSVPE